MKVLWISNSPIGPAAEILGEEYKGSSGGWIQSEYENIEKDGIEFYFLSSLPTIRRGEILKKINNIGTLYCVTTPKLSYGIKLRKRLLITIQKIIDEIKPDLIHIWGTETWISNAVANVETKAPKIVFIQGLIGVHQRYKGGYFFNNYINKPFQNSNNLIQKILIKIKRYFFLKQVEIEKDTINKCGNVIIDNEFSEAYCSSISKDINCYKHILLPNKIFFSKKWDINKCEKNTIFTIYGSSAEKGTQNLLWAIFIVKKEIPNIKVYIPGIYSLDHDGKLINKSKDPFQRILYNMIHYLNLQDNINFTGRLNPSQMAEYLVKCNIFVNTSCMEVHALSLREAMVVGVPCISSLCGSIGEYLKDGINGLIYRYEEYEYLAYKILTILKNNSYAIKLAEKSKETFLYNENNNLFSLYKELCK